MPASQPSLSSLPDELLVAILSHLSLAERHRAVPLVSHRFRQLACSMVQKISLELEPTNAAARLGSLFAWLLHHGAGSVQQLTLAAVGMAPDAQQVAVLTAAVVTACGMSGHLSGLQLKDNACQAPAWAAALPRLRRLVLLRTGRELVWDLSQPAFPELQTLSLRGSPLVVRPAATLPPSLSQLHLCGCSENCLPPQVATLTRLHSLSLKWLECTADGYAALPLGLRRLAVRNCLQWPDCLPQLTSLEALVLDDADWCLQEHGAAEQVVDAALPALSHLTYLALDATPSRDSPPPVLARCPGLRTFLWLEATGGALPGGAWLAGVQQLSAAANTVAGSAPALAVASSLEALHIMCLQSSEAELAAALQAAEHAPALRRVVLAGRHELLLDSSVGLAVQQLERHCPQLTVELHAADHWDDLMPAFNYHFPNFDALE